ncbi:unnamed protein product, partial [Symbiodinium sp. KB8]
MIMLVIIIIIIIMIIIIIIIIIIILKSIIIALFVITDDICRKHKVTKIETVAEEYVACVGVTPSDQASEEILALQEKDLQNEPEFLQRQYLKVKMQVQGDKVKFKMGPGALGRLGEGGLHTGDIVAGVIGSKLPRTMDISALPSRLGLEALMEALIDFYDPDSCFRLFGNTINTAACQTRVSELNALPAPGYGYVK